MMRLGRSAIAIFALLVGFVVSTSLVQAQQGAVGTASLNGTVTDASGATVAGASLKLTDTRTNNTYTAQSGTNGGYRFVDIPPGPAYALTVTKEGFETYTLNGLYLPVSVATTKDLQLTIGQITQTVEVTADTGSVSLNTTDATIGNNLDMHAVESLPNEYRDNVANLLRIQAGVVDARVNSLSAGQSHMDPNHTRDGSVAGARADQNNITVDGIDATDVATGAAFGGGVGVAALPVDAIQEFNTQVAQPGAANGGRSGAQSMIVTKSGTNAWHGSAFEYNRTAATEANTFFNNQVGNPRLALVRNQWGANIGGPVLKNKLFFFFEYSGRHDASQLSELQFVPFPHVAAGEIAYVNNNAGCTINSQRLTASDTPGGCISFAPATEVQALDPCHVAGACGGTPCVITTGTTTCVGAPGFVAAGAAPVLLNAFATRYPKPNDFSVGDGINIAGALFNAPNPLKDVLFVTRVDYNIDPNNKLFGRFNMINYSSINLSNGLQPVQFPGDPLTALETVRDRSWVVGETWTINSATINQFTVGETRQNLQQPIAFAPPPPASLYELSFFSSFEGQNFATPYERQTAAGRVVPDPTLRDDVTLIRGKHTIQFGGQWNPVKIRSNLINDFSFVSEGLGGSFTGLDATLRPANIGTNTAITANWDTFFAGDLGLINNDQTAINYVGSGAALPPGSGANRDWRLYQYAAYGEDSWRIRQDLTITGGLRYQYQGAPYEVHGTEAQFFNTNVADIVATRQSNGLAGISGPDATPLVTYQLSGKGNHQGMPLYNPDKLDFSPRLALAWNPSFSTGVLGHLLGDRKSVVRAGFNFIYDQSVIYAITNFEDQSNYLFGNTVGVASFNGGTTPAFQVANDPRMNSLSAPPFTIVPPAFTNPLTPFASFNDGIDPKLHTPYSMTASLGVQRELPGGFQLDIDYFGRFGRRLMQLADVSQAMDFTDRTPGMGNQTLVQAFSAIEQFSRANSVMVLPPNQNFFEDQMSAALGAPCAVALGMSCTAYVYTNNYGALQQGGTGVVVASIPLPQNVGLTPQFFVNAIMANKGFSDYNAAFVTLRKRLSNGLQFDFNYTFSHSIDNGSTVSNENGNFSQGVTSVMCDVTNNRACRGNSEFDATHQIAAEFVYDLPFGRGQKFGRNAGTLLNEAIGGWSVSGIQTWRTGLAYTVNNTDTALYDTVSLASDTGMLFTGSRGPIQPHPHFDPVSGQEQLFANPAAAGAQFSPVTGLESGTRDNLRGPHFSNLDLSVTKNFPLGGERYRLQFRAEAYNVFNHPNFGLPDSGVTSGQLGVINGLAGAEPSRVMQFALRFDF